LTKKSDSDCWGNGIYSYKCEFGVKRRSKSAFTIAFSMSPTPLGMINKPKRRLKITTTNVFVAQGNSWQQKMRRSTTTVGPGGEMMRERENECGPKERESKKHIK
jgi:hypothetical protein